MKNFSFFIISFLCINISLHVGTAFAQNPVIPMPEPASIPKTDNIPKTDSQEKTESKSSAKSEPDLRFVKYKIVFDGKYVKAFSKDRILSKVPLPASPVRYKILNKTTFIAACGNAGLIIVDFKNPLHPKVRVFDKGNNIVDFRIDANTVIAVGAKYHLNGYHISYKTGKLIPLQDFLKANTLKENSRENKKVKVGTVIRIKNGFAVIKLISDKYVHVGTRVEIRDSSPSKHFDPVYNKVVFSPTMDVLCVADISDMRNGFAVVKLGKGDDPQVGNPVYLSEKSVSSSIRKPRRLGELLRTSFEIMPFPTSVDASGDIYIATLLRMKVDYHFKKPFHVRFALDPILYLGVDNYSSPVGSNIYGTFSYDTDFFEIGVGLGYQWPLLEGESVHNRKGILFVQQVRLGSLDGINALLTVQSVYSDDNSDKIKRAMLGSLAGELNLPITEQLTIFGRYLGDGRVLTHVGFGLKTFVSGNGGRDSIIIPVSFGYTWIEPYYENEDGDQKRLEAKGVTFSIGVEGRY